MDTQVRRRAGALKTVHKTSDKLLHTHNDGEVGRRDGIGLLEIIKEEAGFLYFMLMSSILFRWCRSEVKWYHTWIEIETY